MLDLDKLDDPPKNGAELITSERHRQILELGYRESDEEYTDEQLLAAAISYCFVASKDPHEFNHVHWAIQNWPWDRDSFKPDTPSIRALVKAGALLAAEIDRLLKLERDERPTTEDQPAGLDG